MGGAVGRALREGMSVTLYYGMQDTVCNYVGGYDMAVALQWPGAGDFAKAPLEDLIIGGVPNGKVKSGGGLTWMQVEGAGHMVPINNPLAASFAIETVIPGASSGNCAKGSRGEARPATASETSHGSGITLHLRHLRLLYARGWGEEVVGMQLCGVIAAAAACCSCIAVVVFTVSFRRQGRLADGVRFRRRRCM